MATENVFQDGPYLAAALLCERILDEKDGVKSLIRVVSRITRRAQGQEIPEKMPPFPISLSLFLSMRTGNKAGKHEIRIVLSRPDKTALPALIHRLNLEPPEGRIIDLVINMNLSLDQEGVYWFDVYFEDYLMTKIPLAVHYVTQSSSASQAPPVVQ